MSRETVVTDQPVRRPANAMERVQKRVSDFLEIERHKPMAERVKQVDIANALGIVKGSFNEWLHSEKVAEQGALAHLDILAEMVRMSPAELVQGYRSTLMELAADERRVIQQWRTWPRSVRANVLRLFHYFGELLPEEQSDREYLMNMRQLQAIAPEAHERQLQQVRDALRVARQRQYARTQANALAGPRRIVDNTGPTQKSRGPE